MGNCVWFPELRFSRRDKVLVRVGKAVREQAVRAAVAAAGEIRINKMRFCRLMCGKALPFRSRLVFIFLKGASRKGEAFPHIGWHSHRRNTARRITNVGTLYS